MRNWSLKKKIGMGALALFVVLCIVAAIVVPLEFCIRLGEESEWMWSPEQEFSVEYAAGTLRKDPDKDFVIVNFTDTQAYLPSDFDSIGKIYKTMKKVIDETNPDLITLTGDQAWFPPTRQSYAKLAKVLDRFGIPWTFVFGNHDHEGNSDLNYLIEVAQKSKYCLIDKGPRNVMGVGNCFINIVEKQPNGQDKIVHTLIMLDSGNSGYDYTEEQTYYDETPLTEEDIVTINVNASSLSMSKALKDCTMDFNVYPYLEEISKEDEKGNQITPRVKVGKSYSAIDYSQIAWYEWVLKGVEKTNIDNGFTLNSMPESTCLFHIPLNEYYDAYKEWLTAIRDNDVEKVNLMQAEGRMRMLEGVASATINTGMFAKMKALGSTKNVIVGHDHINDFSLVYQGIRLTYGVKTGNKCYWTEDGSMNGGTKLTISAGGKATTLKQVYVDDYKK